MAYTPTTWNNDDVITAEKKVGKAKVGKTK